MKEIEPIEGNLEFFSETGTEGGYWAFQDEKFTHIPNDTEKCSICGFYREYLESLHEEKTGSSLIVARSLTMTQTLARGFDKGPCETIEHKWELAYPDGMSSYEGLHVLRDGDKLTIFDKEKPEITIWDGIISLKQLGLFTEHAHGWWIHTDQIGIERETWARWFLREYPGRLIPIGDTNG